MHSIGSVHQYTILSLDTRNPGTALMQGADSSPEASPFHAHWLCFDCTIKKAAGFAVLTGNK